MQETFECLLAASSSLKDSINFNQFKPFFFSKTIYKVTIAVKDKVEKLVLAYDILKCTHENIAKHHKNI